MTNDGTLDSRESKLSTTQTTKLEKTKVDWSTPYDEWLIPLLNKARHCGPIEFRAIPSVVQLEFDKVLKAEASRIALEARTDERQLMSPPLADLTKQIHTGRIIDIEALADHYFQSVVYRHDARVEELKALTVPEEKHE